MKPIRSISRLLPFALARAVSLCLFSSLHAMDVQPSTLSQLSPIYLKKIKTFLSSKDLNSLEASQRASHIPTRVLDTFKALDQADNPGAMYAVVKEFRDTFPFELQDTFQERHIIKDTLARVKDAFTMHAAPYLTAPYHQSAFSAEELEIIGSIMDTTSNLLSFSPFQIEDKFYDSDFFNYRRGRSLAFLALMVEKALVRFLRDGVITVKGAHIPMQGHVPITTAMRRELLTLLKRMKAYEGSWEEGEKVKEVFEEARKACEEEGLFASLAVSTAPSEIFCLENFLKIATSSGHPHAKQDLGITKQFPLGDFLQCKNFPLLRDFWKTFVLSMILVNPKRIAHTVLKRTFWEGEHTYAPEPSKPYFPRFYLREPKNWALLRVDFPSSIKLYSPSEEPETYKALNTIIIDKIKLALKSQKMELAILKNSLDSYRKEFKTYLEELSAYLSYTMQEHEKRKLKGLMQALLIPPYIGACTWEQKTSLIPPLEHETTYEEKIFSYFQA